MKEWKRWKHKRHFMHFEKPENLVIRKIDTYDYNEFKYEAEYTGCFNCHKRSRCANNSHLEKFQYSPWNGEKYVFEKKYTFPRCVPTTYLQISQLRRKSHFYEGTWIEEDEPPPQLVDVDTNIQITGRDTFYARFIHNRGGIHRLLQLQDIGRVDDNAVIRRVLQSLKGGRTAIDFNWYRTGVELKRRVRYERNTIESIISRLTLKYLREKYLEEHCKIVVYRASYI